LRFRSGKNWGLEKQAIHSPVQLIKRYALAMTLDKLNNGNCKEATMASGEVLHLQLSFGANAKMSSQNCAPARLF
jgi:hypothetical protein